MPWRPTSTVVARRVPRRSWISTGSAWAYRSLRRFSAPMDTLAHLHVRDPGLFEDGAVIRVAALLVEGVSMELGVKHDSRQSAAVGLVLQGVEDAGPHPPAPMSNQHRHATDLAPAPQLARR